MARKQTAKTVPFGLVLPLRSARNGVDGARFHRRQPLRPGGFSCGPLVYERHTSQRKRPAIRRPSGLIIVFEAGWPAAVIHGCSFCFGAAPTWREAISPPLKIIRVGPDITPYSEAVFGLSSTLSLTILTLSPIAPEISSSAGAIMRQGPHHSAQKSTTTGPVALSTSASKSASETLPTAMGIPRSVANSSADENRAPDDMGQPMNAILPGQARSRRDDKDASAASSAGAEISINSGVSVQSSA